MSQDKAISATELAKMGKCEKLIRVGQAITPRGGDHSGSIKKLRSAESERGDAAHLRFELAAGKHKSKVKVMVTQRFEHLLFKGVVLAVIAMIVVKFSLRI
jgi:hypothetical protein